MGRLRYIQNKRSGTAGTIFTGLLEGKGTTKIHSHQLASGVEYANEFKGEFLSATGIMDGIAAHYHLGISSAGVLRAILGVAYLDAGITLSGTAATGSWISGGLFSCGLAATSVLNGTAVLALGSYSEVTSTITSTLTTVKHVAAICGTGKLLVKPTTGECSLVYLVQAAGATTINQAIYIEGGATVDSFLTIDVAASGKAIETATSAMSTNATSHALHIKIGAADGYIPVYDNNAWT